MTEEYLTDTGKEVIRAMYYKIQVKKQKLRESNASISSYEYQAIQQREIALDTMFTELITFPSKKTTDEDTTVYYEYLAKNHREVSFNVESSEEPLTMDGISKVLSLYRDDLIAIAAAWHDGIFTYLPHINNVADIEPCTVNYNYLERQQGFRAALTALGLSKQTIRMTEDDVRNSIYTLQIDPNGGNHYVELTHYKKDN